jgi:histidine triad (HIT) family protein
MEDCIFCRIATGEIPSYKIWEDQNHVAILDIFPNTKGQALLLPKQHEHSDPADVSPQNWESFMRAAQTVSQKMKRALGVYRVAMVVEGMGVNHLHVKLYPLYGLDETWRPHIPTERVVVESYPGYITTQLGPSASAEELQHLAQKIRSKDPLRQ